MMGLRHWLWLWRELRAVRREARRSPAAPLPPVVAQAPAPARRPSHKRASIPPARPKRGLDADARQVRDWHRLPTEPPASESLANFVVRIGGFDPADVEFAEVREATGGKRMRPGFQRRPGKGLSVDRVREAAAEAGYWGGGVPSFLVDRQDLLDALQQEANGQRFYPPERLAEFEANAEIVQQIEDALATTTEPLPAAYAAVAPMILKGN